MQRDFHDFKQLYDYDQYRQTAQVKVLYMEELAPADKSSGARYKIITDQTIFYPEGGGQPGDCGTISSLDNSEIIHVLDTRYAFKASDKAQTTPYIFHFTDKPIAVGSQVIEQIDWSRRFTHMQQHSSEHIISGLVHNKYGYNNVGFHLGKTETTIDFDGSLTYEQIQAVIKTANQIIWQNNPIESKVFTAAEAQNIQYRSKIELNNLVRLVKIPAVDTCACCGTHVKATGDIGIIICTSIESYRSGCRVTFLAGQRAFEKIRAQQEMEKDMVHLLNSPDYALDSAVEKLIAKNTSLESSLENTANSLWDKTLSHVKQRSVIYIDTEIFTAKIIKRLVKSLAQNSNYELLILQKANSNLSFFLTEPKDIFTSDNSMFTYLKNQYNVRGGGKADLVQGQIDLSQEKVPRPEEFSQKLAAELNADFYIL